MNERTDVDSAHHARSPRAGAWLAALAPVLLGTIGSGWTDLQIASNCADHFSCGDLSCPPCATSLNWVLAQFVGEWIFVMAATVFLILERRHLVSRLTTERARFSIPPVAIIWFLVSAAVALHF